MIKATMSILLAIFVFSNIMIGQVINVNPDPNGPPYIAGDASPIPPEIAASMPSLILTTASLATPLPEIVDNSQLMYMPPVYNQGASTSCVQVAEIWYAFAYEINRLRNLPAGDLIGDENKNNQYFPLYTFNFLNGGDGYDTNGTAYTSGYSIIKQNGCPSYEVYDDPSLNSSTTKYIYWMNGIGNYQSGMHNKIDGFGYISWGSSYESLEPLKHWIADHGMGDTNGGLAIISVYGDQLPQYTVQFPEGRIGHPGHYISQWGTTGGHALTIVGYNDNVECFELNGHSGYENEDIDGDSVIELSECEKGAFKVVNSWGVSFADSGYVYIPYKLLASGLQTNFSSYKCNAISENEPSITIKSSITHPSRNKLTCKLGYADTANAINPKATTALNSFNRQGGANEMRGAYSGPIEIGLDFGYFYGNEDFGKIYFIVNSIEPGNSLSDTIKQFSIIDHRWGVDFELDCGEINVPILNGDNQLSIEYDLIPHEQPITSNLTFNSNMVSRFTPTVTHSTLTVGEVNKEVKIDMYESELIIEEGSSLVVGKNCDFYALRGASKISINGYITTGTDITFASGDLNSTIEIDFNNPNQTVYFEGCNFSKCIIKSVSPLVFNNCEFNYTTISSHADLTADNCHFNNSSIKEQIADIEITGSAFDHSSIIASNPSIGSIPINNTAIITSNGFTTANSDAGSVIEVYGYRNYNISENTINTVDSPASTSHGIAIHYSGTTDARNMHTISNNTIFCEESNCTHSISGITLYSSVADITVRNNIHHNFIGIQSLGNSQVKLLGDPTATNVSNAQRIINNRRVQLYASQNAFPTQTDHNVMYSAVAADCFVRHDVSGIINPPKVNVANNYWGPSFNQAVNLCPAGHYDYTPIWDLSTNTITPSNAQQLIATADSLVADSNYTAAKATYQQVVTTYPEKEQAISSMKAVLYLEPLAGNNFDGLKEWYLNEPAILNNELLLKLSDNLANKCNEKLESYPEAIAWYENVIQNPETLEDSIFAIIDLEHLYWQMGIDTSLRSTSYVGSMAQYKPKSFQSFKDQKDELLRLLYGTKTNVAENEPIVPEDKLFNGSLSQNIPNPCSGKTQIFYTLEAESAIQLNIYNYTGQLIKSVNVGIRPEGTHTLVFDAGCLNNGVYFYTLNMNGRNSASKKMMVLK